MMVKIRFSLLDHYTLVDLDKYSRVRSVASVPLRLPDLAAEAAVLHGTQRRRRRLPAAGANPVALS